MGKVRCGSCGRYLGVVTGGEAELKCPSCKAMTHVVFGLKKEKKAVVEPLRDGFDRCLDDDIEPE